ncbi:alanine racemase [Croceiramulus getboli]|nr:alanine racemase [Flavobacteriaceae bacterium YJPT1-3]
MAATRLEINLNALTHNFEFLKSKLSPETKTLAVVKAFGYGSDAAAVARHLENLAIDYFAVAYVSEGVALRDAGITTPILVLHPQAENLEQLIDRCLEPSLYSARIFKAFLNVAQEKEQVHYPVHLKFNTGLNRLGFWENDVNWILDRFREMPTGKQGRETLRVKSIFSHLVASEDPAEHDFTQQQIASFRNSAQDLMKGLHYTPLLHQSNTSAVINYPEAQFDMVRIGIGLYGYGNDPSITRQLQPVATLKTIISQIHQIEPGESVGYNRAYFAKAYERTATLPLGHADGISRTWGQGKGYVTIHGQKAPIIGNVCMDMLMVNISGIDCQEGDEVVVFGEGASTAALAEALGTIPYELLTAVSQRVERLILS